MRSTLAVGLVVAGLIGGGLLAMRHVARAPIATVAATPKVDPALTSAPLMPQATYVPETPLAFTTISGKEKQVEFTSDAPFEDIVGWSNQVEGGADLGPTEQPAKLSRASWRLPVASMRTGIATRDQHISDAEWLDAKNYPDIRYDLRDVRDVKEVPGGPGRTFEGTLVGDVTVRGVLRRVEARGALITILPKDEAPADIGAPMLRVRADLAVRLSEHGVKNTTLAAGRKVADEITIKVDVVMAGRAE
jgi:polyisoprenoid-binding protein YceI